MESSSSERRKSFAVVSHPRTIKRAEDKRQLQQKAEKYEKSKTDSLTGLPSHFALEEIIDNFNPGDYPPNSSLLIVYVDLTGVKEINDTLSHDDGDDYIRYCAQKLNGYFRIQGRQDILIRNVPENPDNLHRQHDTGDEFIALLVCPQTDTNEAILAVENRLNQVNSSPGNNPSATVPKIAVAFRYGIAHAALPSDNTHNREFFADLINQADANLNQKKRLEINPNSR